MNRRSPTPHRSMFDQALRDLAGHVPGQPFVRPRLPSASSYWHAVPLGRLASIVRGMPQHACPQCGHTEACTRNGPEPWHCMYCELKFPSGAARWAATRILQQRRSNRTRRH